MHLGAASGHYVPGVELLDACGPVSGTNSNQTPNTGDAYPGSESAGDKLQNEQVGNYYGVPVTIIENSAVYKSSSALSADEIAVFRVSSEAEKKIAASAVDGRLSDCRSSYSTLSSDENRKIDNCLVEVSGDYVIMVICGDPGKASEAISEFYK